MANRWPRSRRSSWSETTFGVNCWDKAVQLLARRPHFRRQLELKLQKKRFPQDEIDAALVRLTDLGYLDDLRCATDYIDQQLRRGLLGRRRLLADLLRRGVEEDVAQEALTATLPEDDLKATRQSADLWLSRRRFDRGALGRHLSRRGFSQRAILRVVEEHATAGGSPLDAADADGVE